jgi:hypothetical protein
VRVVSVVSALCVCLIANSCNSSPARKTAKPTSVYGYNADTVNSLIQSVDADDTAKLKKSLSGVRYVEGEVEGLLSRPVEKNLPWRDAKLGDIPGSVEDRCQIEQILGVSKEVVMANWKCFATDTSLSRTFGFKNGKLIEISNFYRVGG